MPENYGKRIPCDPRVIDRIQRSPSMMAEQGSSFLSGWGGPQAYQMVARLPMAQRATYYAVVEGLQTPEEISTVTDLSINQVESALNQLDSRGLITIQEAEL